MVTGRLRTTTLALILTGLLIVLGAAPAAAAAPAPMLAAGAQFTCGLSSAGGVECWGYNGSGELGNGTATTSSRWVKVIGLGSGVSAIAAGGYYACALTSAGGVKCWGDNRYGQLGNGTTTPSSAPVDVIGLGSGVTAIAAGGYQACALLSAGAVKCWGRNDRGQLGNGAQSDSATPVDVSGLGSGVVAIAAGLFHSCAVMSSGGAKCWGFNGPGELGNGTTTSSLTPVDVSGLSGATAITAGHYHTCALTNVGAVKCWGNNDWGELGNGTVTSSSTPVNVTGLGSGVSAVTAAGYHDCVLMSSGAVKCWGYNSSAELGNGTTNNSAVPLDVTGLGSGIRGIAAGWTHTCAVMSVQATVKCWGDNGSGELGNGSMTSSSVPVLAPWAVLGPPMSFSALAAGEQHTCALTSAGAVKCFGDNGSGELGIGTATDLWPPSQSWPLGDATGLHGGVTAITAGGEHTCALTSAGAVKCWGHNTTGELGNGTTTNTFMPVDVTGLASGVTAISAGRFDTCALTSGGAVMCWGGNASGQLGNGTTTDSSVPVAVSGLGSGVTAIAAGDFHACAVTSGGAAKCWGDGSQGELGNGTTAGSTVPVEVTGLGSGVTAIAASVDHTCALTTGGGVKCWGHGLQGQLGNGTSTDSSVPVDVNGLGSGVTAIAAGVDYNCALTSAGAVKCWGSVADPGVTGISAIVAGRDHVCALTKAGAVRCWGSNASGDLVDGTTADSSTPVDAFIIPAQVDQTISFAPPGDVAVGDADADLGGSASSGLPVSYSSATPAVCTIVAGRLHAAAAGSCTIGASQAGDEVYTAAVPVQRTFTIAPAAPAAPAGSASPPPAAAPAPPVAPQAPPAPGISPRTPPIAVALSALGVTPNRLSTAGRTVGGRCVTPTARNRTKLSCRRPVVLTISYTLAGPATVAFTLQLRTTGREAKGTCVAPTQGNRRDRPCPRLTIVPGRIVRASRAGANRFTFAGVIGGHRLAPGTYALTGTPSGGSSASARFQIGS